MVDLVKYRARVLPPEEFFRLQGLPLYDTVAGTGSLVVVVEDETGTIVATWSALWTLHLEGLYVVPGCRHSPRVAISLYDQMFQALQDLGVRQVLTVTQDPIVGGMTEKIGGQKVDGDLWVIPVPTPAPTEG